MKLLLPLILLSVLTFLSINRRHRANADSTCPKNCRPHTVQVHCNKTTGECSEGCITGFFGLTCNKICQCGGGACAITDGTCMQTPTEKPVPVNPGHQCKDCQTDGYIAGISVLCVVVVLIAVVILIIKFKRFFQESSGQQVNGQEGNRMLSDNNQPQLEPLLVTEKERLAQDLGVHLLYHPDQPNKLVILYCVHMKFDYRKVNTSTAHISRDQYLVNEPENDSRMKQFSERFKKFNGSISVSPTLHGDIPTYWEVHTHIQLNNQLQTADLLLCIGLCIETERDKDQCIQTPFGVNCYNVNVGICSEHDLICTKIYRGTNIEPVADVQTDIENKKGQHGDLKYGILVCKGKNLIVYFDLTKMKHIASLANVDFESPLWPMFGVFKKSDPSVRMKLKTGQDMYIDMSQEKKDMILRALSSVRCDQ